MQSQSQYKDVTRQSQIHVGFALNHLQALFSKEQALINAGVNMVCDNAHLRRVNSQTPATWWHEVVHPKEVLEVSQAITEWMTDFPMLTGFQARRQKFSADAQARLAQALRPYQQAARGHYQPVR